MSAITKKFRLHFYQIKVDETLFPESTNENKLIDLIQSLKKVSKPKDVYEVNGYKAFIRLVDSENNIFCFEKHRIDDFPAIGSIKDNKERNLDLNKDETLIEKNYFLINEDMKYIIYQEKNEGFRATTLTTYFNALNSELNKIEISQILKQAAYKRLTQYGYLKGMEITLASPNDKMLKDFGISLNDRILYKKNQNMNVSVKVSLTTKNSYPKKFIQNILNEYNKHSDNIKKFNIKGSDTKKAHIEDVNLAKNVIESIADVRITNGHIEEDDMKESIMHSLKVHKDEIEEILG